MLHKYVSTWLQNLIQHTACLRVPKRMKTAVVVVVVLSVVALSLAVPLDNVSRVRREENKDNKGGVDVDVHREKGVGTVVGVKGEGNVWSSQDGNTKVDAQGQWSRVYDGPARGKPNYGGGLHFSHKF